MRRAGIFWWRDEAAADTRREWKDRSRASGGDDRAPAGVARAKAAHTQHHASDGAGDVVSTRGDRADRGVRAGALASAAQGRRAIRQRRGRARVRAESDHLGSGRGRALFRRNEEWTGRRRAGDFFQEGAGPRLRLPREASGTARIKDALSRRALAGIAAWRRVARDCATLQCTRTNAHGKINGAGNGAGLSTGRERGLRADGGAARGRIA